VKISGAAARARHALAADPSTGRTRSAPRRPRSS